MAHARPLSTFLWTLIGPAVWFMHLSAVYAGATITCSRPGFEMIFLIGAVVLTAGALASLSAYCIVSARALQSHRSGLHDNRADESLNVTGLALALLSTLAVIWTSAPALTLACGPH